MASREHSRTDEDPATPGPTDDDAPDGTGRKSGGGTSVGSVAADSVRRIVVYGVLILALLVVMWSLIEGGDRDLWSPSAALGLLPALVIPAP